MWAASVGFGYAWWGCGHHGTEQRPSHLPCIVLVVLVNANPGSPFPGEKSHGCHQLCSQPGTPRGDHSVRTEVATASPAAPLGLTCPCSRTRRRGSKRLRGNPPKKRKKEKNKTSKKLLKQSRRRGLKPQRCLCRTPLRLQPWARGIGKEKISCPAAGWEDGAARGLLGSPGFSSGLSVSPACPWGSHLIAVTQLSICASPR